jgi:spore coat polysaccharide biosynthesis protein SpsF
MPRRICVILQARITSTRLIAKVLMEICNKPMIYLIIERLKHCKKIDDIILAIPDTYQNDILEEYATKIGCHYARGSENDVLSRYYQVAKQFDVTDIIRVTADCPLIDPRLVDFMVDYYLIEKVDYVTIDVDKYFPRGLDAEIFSFETLKIVNMDAHQDYEREHVTPYIYGHPELFKIKFLEAEKKLTRPELRLTVDTQEDFNLVNEIYKNLYDKDKLFYADDVIDFLDAHPELLLINKFISQKKLRE